MTRRRAPAPAPAGGARLGAAVTAAREALARDDFDAAGRHLEAALRLAPDHPDLLTNLGGVRARQHRLDEAVVALERALGRAPDHEVARRNLVVTLGARGNDHLAAARLSAGVADLRRALSLDPTAAELESALGLGLCELGRPTEALAHYRRALERLPRHAVTLNRLALALLQLGRLGEARVALEEAVAADPALPEALVNLSAVCNELGRVDEAERWGRQAQELRPEAPEVHNNLALALRERGDVAGALAHFERACAIAPDNFLWQSGRLLTLSYLPATTAPELAAAHRAVGDRWVAAVKGRARMDPADRNPDRRLRVGYLSPDFRTHSVAYFLESFLGHHDRAAVEVIAYSASPVADEVTARLRQLVPTWREVQLLSDADCAELVARDRVDVLVDLAGHTARNRLGVFARRAAPVQLTYLGYGVTTGLPTMDGLLSDDLADPPADVPSAQPERPLLLPGGYLCYHPPQAAPPPALPSGPITFGSFNNLAKISDPTVDAWAALLQALPPARLLLKARGLSSEQARARLLERFAARGVAPERLLLAPPTSGVAEHLAQYHQVHVALDTFPYNGTTTTCEALWMGVPVVTVAGATHMARVGRSITARVGLEDLVAATPTDYVRIATTLAQDRDRLAALRRDLRERMRASPLMDGVRLARALEDAYRAAWTARSR